MSEAAKSVDWTGPLPVPRREAFRGYAAWLAAAAAFAVVPYLFSSGAGLTMLSLMGIMIVFTLSYNMLLGQTGMLSFGHAVYYGLGAFFAAHAMNAVIRSDLAIPVVVDDLEPLELTSELAVAEPAFDPDQWAESRAEAQGAGGRHVLRCLAGASSRRSRVNGRLGRTADIIGTHAPVVLLAHSRRPRS